MGCDAWTAALDEAVNLPDPDDPDFKAEVRVLRWHLFAATCFVLGFVSLVVAFLT
jgi:hypothetical protein